MEPSHKKARAQLRVGCSGWQYKHWRGSLYPPELPQSRWFAHYALTFRLRRNQQQFQLLPRFPMNLERLEHFLKVLPKRYRHTVEFRDASWYDERVYELLRRHDVALCLHDMQGSAYAYFNNDTGGHAPRDTVRLRQRIQERLGTGSHYNQRG